ncbi:hypothetical protein C2S53_010539 [Perilla frutescens var. hirtella]|uniref:HMA domain-containing protein n=1 Tax=Perilla frutescens var. hirtella TaxID=608512 RepID=A0AAD4PDV5_PERFH|nr:hypothetical protein C2S53_010539 [Perilla frutescens var. hirtella]
MQPYAEATCVLKVEVDCQACKMTTMEILGSVCGIYNLDINAEEGLAKVQAVVEPNLFLKALARTGPHAKPKWVKLQHPKMNQSYYHNYNYNTHSYGNGYNHGAIGYNPYNHNYTNGYNHGAIADPYHYSTMEPHYPYHGSNPYYYGSGLPPARYVPYADDPINFCNMI